MINLLKHFNNNKTTPEPFFVYQAGNNPKWTVNNYDSISEEGFLKNVIAYRSINLISRSIASIPMILKEKTSCDRIHNLNIDERKKNHYDNSNENARKVYSKNTNNDNPDNNSNNNNFNDFSNFSDSHNCCKNQTTDTNSKLHSSNDPRDLRFQESQTQQKLRILQNVLSRPNSMQSRGAFIEHLVNYLLISGNAFVHWGEGPQMMCLRSDRVQIVPNAEKTSVNSYIYNVDSQKFKINKEDLLHLKFFNPLNDWYGISPLSVASRAIDQHNAMSAHNFAILQNAGRPSGCLMLKPYLSANFSETQMKKLRENVQKTYAGTLNAGKIMVLEGDFDWKEMGLSPKDLDFSNGKDFIIREIAQAFGVPPVLVGLRGDSGFANYKEARLHFWEDTVLPLAEIIRLEFNNWFSQKFNLNVEITFDLDSIHALTARRDILWQKVSSADFLTINEKRELLGFPPLKSENDKNANGGNHNLERIHNTNNVS